MSLARRGVLVVRDPIEARRLSRSTISQFHAMDVTAIHGKPLEHAIEQLTHCTTIQWAAIALDLPTIDAAAAFTLASCLKHNRTLQILDLSTSKLGGMGAQVLVRALTTNVVRMCQDDIEAPQRRVHSLRKLVICAARLTDQGAEQLVPLLVNDELEELDLRGNDVRWSGIDTLAHVVECLKGGRLEYVYLDEEVMQDGPNGSREAWIRIGKVLKHNKRRRQPQQQCKLL